MKRLGSLLILAVLAGAGVSAIYLGTHEPPLLFSDLILELSGSRLRTPLYTNTNGILKFNFLMIPYFAFQALVGIWVYRSYCAASVYVFSRISDRGVWYLRSARRIAGASIFFELAFLISVWLTAAIRFEIRYDPLGWTLAFYHLILYSLWIYAATILMNLVAVRWGSSRAYVIVAGGQLLMTTVFLPLQASDDPAVTAARAAILRWDPAACLVLGWQTGRWPWPFDVGSSYPGLNIEISTLILLLIAVSATVLGTVLVKRQDLLLSDAESGGI